MVFAAGANITITATASDPDGSVTNVEFFADSRFLGSDAESPYSVTECCWKPGHYLLKAKATDNLGASKVSDPVPITVAESVPASGSGFWQPEPHLDPLLTYYGAAALKAYGYDVYIGLNGDAPPFMKWDGTNCARWHVDGSFPFARTFGIVIDGSNVCVAGSFVDSSGYGVAEWNGTQWDILGETLTPTSPPTGNRENSKPVTISIVNRDIYVGGQFVSAGTNSNIQYIAKLNRVSNTWDTVGEHLNGPVYAIESISDKLFIGGGFTSASGNSNANYIAQLQGNVWTGLGSGVGGTNSLGDHGAVFALAACGTNLYVGGDFISVGGNTNANGIGVWNGQHWNVLHRGLIGYSSGFDARPDFMVYSIAPKGDSIYVAGKFSAVWGDGTNQIPAYSVARATWSEDRQAWSWTDLDIGTGFYFDADHNPVGVGYAFSTTILDDPTPGVYDLFVSGLVGPFGTLP